MNRKLRASLTAILPLAVVAGMVTGCTDHGKTKDADRREGEANVAMDKATQLQKQYEEKLASAQKSSDENKKNADALAVQVADWKTKQADRDRLLLELEGQVSAEKATLGELMAQKSATIAYIESEQKRIAGERSALQQKVADINTEITNLKAATDKELAANRDASKKDIEAKETAFTVKLAALEKRITEANDRDQTLTALDTQLKAQKEAQITKDADLTKLQASLTEREANLQASIQTTRELFMKSAEGDVFNHILDNKNYVFFVKIVGFGSPKNITSLREKLDALNGPTGRYAKLKHLSELGKDPKNKTGVDYVTDSFLVETTGQAMKATRELADKELQALNQKGEAAKYNSIWMIVRPVEKVQMGLKLQVHGSETKYFEGRKSKVVASFDNIHGAQQTVLNLDDLDLTKPGSYVFASGANAKACEKVTPDCIRALTEEGFLDAQQTMSVDTARGTDTITGPYRELLAQLMHMSILQSVDDLKERTVVGLKLDKFDHAQWTLDWKALHEKYAPVFVNRAPVLDDVSITYTVSMVESISPVANHLDSMSYLYSGFVGTNKMFDLNGKNRGELTIQLPIEQYQESHSVLSDLSLTDYVAKNTPPVKSAELIAAEATRNSRNSALGQRYVQLKKDFDKATSDAAAGIVPEKQNEFEERSYSNAGVLKAMIDALSKK